MINNPNGSTIAAKAGHFLDVHSGAITPEIQTSTTFARDDRYDLINAANAYIRDQNPTFVHAERLLSDLECGEESLLFASGMAAIAAIFYTLRPGSHIVVPDSMYWGVSSFLREHCERADILMSTYQTSRPETIEAALASQNHTSIVWVETPSNPFLHVTDIKVAAELAHQYDARLCVDSTVATPVFTRPLELGADLVIHSATKYLNGHSDALCGALVTRDEHELWQAVKKERAQAGAQPGSFDAWLLLRGMRTLYVRVRQASANAAKIADFLNAHIAVESVAYPGLEDHPGHDIAKSQMQGGYGSLLSFTVVGGRDRALAVAGRLQLITSATSLGGVESLIEHRHSIEPPENAIPDNQLRLSVGIEDIDDLMEDLDSALR